MTLSGRRSRLRSRRTVLAATGLALAWLIWPNLVTAQAARVLDPRTERAPHCPYTFVIEPSAAAVLYGDPFELTVRVSGVAALALASAAVYVIV